MSCGHIQSELLVTIISYKHKTEGTTLYSVPLTTLLGLEYTQTMTTTEWHIGCNASSRLHFYGPSHDDDKGTT